MKKLGLAKGILIVLVLCAFALPAYAVVESEVAMPAARTLSDFQRATKPNVGWLQYQSYQRYLEKAPAPTLAAARIRTEGIGLEPMTLTDFEGETKPNAALFAFQNYEKRIQAAGEIAEQSVPVSDYHQSSKATGTWSGHKIWGGE
jgi:hypothetical protein